MQKKKQEDKYNYLNVSTNENIESNNEKEKKSNRFIRKVKRNFSRLLINENSIIFTVKFPYNCRKT